MEEGPWGRQEHRLGVPQSDAQASRPSAGSPPPPVPRRDGSPPDRYMAITAAISACARVTARGSGQDRSATGRARQPDLPVDAGAAAHAGARRRPTRRCPTPRRCAASSTRLIAGTVSVVADSVVDVGTGSRCTTRAGRPTVPASTTKLLTAAAVLATRGPALPDHHPRRGRREPGRGRPGRRRRPTLAVDEQRPATRARPASTTWPTR